MNKYIVLLGFFGGYSIIRLRLYKKNDLFHAHTAAAIGTKRYLRKLGFII